MLRMKRRGHLSRICCYTFSQSGGKFVSKFVLVQGVHVASQEFSLIQLVKHEAFLSLPWRSGSLILCAAMLCN